MRHRQRNRLSFEPLMLTPGQINAFFGVENDETTAMQPSSSQDTPTETERRDSSTYNMNVTDNSLWRTMPDKENQTLVGSDGKRDSTTYNMHVSDNPLWRTMPTSAQDRTQATFTTDSKRESTKYDFHITDDPLWRTMPTPAQDGTQTHIEMESKRESTTFNMHVTDNPLWRTQVASQISFASEDRRESTVYNMHVTDDQLWRTMPANQSSTQTSIESDNRRESTNMHVTDNELWRTQVAGDKTNQTMAETDNKHESTAYNMHVTDDQLWRTMPANQSNTQLSFAGESHCESTNNDLHATNQTLQQTMPAIQEERQSPFELGDDRDSLIKDFDAAENMRGQTLPAIQEESRTYIESQDKPESTSTSQQISFNFVTPPRDSQEKRESTSFRKPVNFHFASPTRASLAKTSAGLPDCNRCERSAEKIAHLPQRNPPRQSVEAFTQTSVQNRDRRRTVLQLMHENSPGLPRRSIFIPPSNINNFQRRTTAMAPFFRLSSGSDSSTPKRTSVASTENDKESPVRSKIPLRSPRSLPSAKSSSSRKSVSSSPRLADRVRVNEAIKVLHGTPTTSRLPVPKKPDTPPMSQDKSSMSQENDEPPQIVQLTNALQQIGIDYKTPDTTPRVVASKQNGAQKSRIDFNMSPSTPTRSNLFNSMFSTTEVKSGKIPHKTATFNASTKPQMLFNISDSLNGSTTQDEDGPLSQQIPSQLPLGRKPLCVLNDDDFTHGSPATPRVQRPARSSYGIKEAARCLPNIPNESHFVSETPPRFSMFNMNESVPMSVASGGSDRDTDVDSPAPKHVILRNKPKGKQEPYMYVQPPKIVKGTDEHNEEHPNLRRSQRTRFNRKLKLGEKPIYERDENGDYNLIGVQKGYTADSLCKKFGTFNKDTAMELQKKETLRRKRVREMNRAQRAAMNEKYGVIGEESP